MSIETEITEEYINKCRPLSLAKDNALRNLSGCGVKITEDDVNALLSGMIKRTVNDAREFNIATNWTNQSFIKLFRAIYRHNLICLSKKNSFMLSECKKGNIEMGHIPLISDFAKEPEVWEKIKNELTLKENESISNMTLITTTQCGKCKKWEIFKISMQVRKADEGDTIFFKCVNCGNQWRN